MIQFVSFLLRIEVFSHHSAEIQEKGAKRPISFDQGIIAEINEGETFTQ
jgi:hypothetical protein